MEIFLVGGAVRDTLLGRKVSEKDWLVVGAGYEECLQQGWRPVASGVPVFRHPETGEEYAMARTERKVGAGYRGFEFNYGAHITLEQDLQRRDLTINALAMDKQGNLADPCGFAPDLRKRLIRHISPRFAEDPLRVVRLCSLYARLRGLSFSVSPATLELMQSMTSATNATEEFTGIGAQQLWGQVEKALSSDAPEAFAEMISRSGAGQMLLPAGLLEPDAVERLKLAGTSLESPIARLAVWTYPLSAHEKEQFFARYEPPKAYRRLCDKLSLLYPFYAKACDKPVPAILEIFKKLNAFSEQDTFSELLQCCYVIFLCAPDTPEIPQVQKEFLNTMLGCAARIDSSRILRRNIEGTPQMAVEIDKHRCAEMARVRRYYPWSDLSVGKNRPGDPDR